MNSDIQDDVLFFACYGFHWTKNSVYWLANMHNNWKILNSD